MGSNNSKATETAPPAVISEKRMIFEKPQSPAADKASVEVEEALTSDNITKWTKALEDVRHIVLNPETTC